MKIIKFLTFIIIIYIIIFISEAGIVNLYERYNAPVEEAVLTDSHTAEVSLDSDSELETPFEKRYDLTDSELDVNSLNFLGVKEIENTEDWEKYLKYCIDKGYCFVFFKAPSELKFDPDTFMSKNDITKAIIYTKPSLTGNSTITGYNFTYTFSHDILRAVKNGTEASLPVKQQQTLSKAKAFIESLPADMSDYDKELAIHNYVCQSIEYTKDEAQEDIINSYGGLILGRGNCQAYTDAFDLLCGLAGFKSGRITCISDGIEHSLNYIVINGGYYFVDCTFDDGIDDKERGYGFFYFNAPYSVISSDHSFGELDFTPVREPDSNYYYVHYDLYADSPYGLETIYKRLCESSNSGEILFNSANGEAELTDIFYNYHPVYTSRISVSKFTFGPYRVLKYVLS